MDVDDNYNSDVWIDRQWVVKTDMVYEMDWSGNWTVTDNLANGTPLANVYWRGAEVEAAIAEAQASENRWLNRLRAKHL